MNFFFFAGAVFCVGAQWGSAPLPTVLRRCFSLTAHHVVAFGKVRMLVPRYVFPIVNFSQRLFPIACSENVWQPI